MKRKTKNNPAPSGVYKNPKWQRKCDGSQGYELTGEEIGRDLKDKWRISLYEPSEKNGSKKQWYVCTITYWDIADDRYGQNKGGLSGLIRDRLNTLFPQCSPSDIDGIGDIIRQKLAPVRDGVSKEYQESEEYYYRLIQDLIGQKKKEYEIRQETEVRQKPCSHTPNDKDIALRIIHAGYKKIAAEYHPDTGGDTDMMRQLNNVKDKLLRLSRSGFRDESSAT